MTRSTPVTRIFSQVFLAVGSVLALLPVCWIVLTAFKSNADATSGVGALFDFTPTIDSFSSVLFSPVFRNALVTSVLVTVTVTGVVLILATFTSYALARLRVPGRRLLVSVMVIVQISPAVVLLIPMFRIVSRIGLYDRWIILAVMLSGLLLPFATWLMLAFIRSVPVEVEEAAMVDGANRPQIMIFVLVPMLAPGLVAASIFTAIAAWNSYIIPVVLAQSRAQTLTVFVATFVTQQEIQWSEMSATATIVIAPIVLFVLFLQRPLVSGIAAGSLK